MSKDDDGYTEDEWAVINRLIEWDGCEFCGANETLKLVGDYWICTVCEDTLNLEIQYYEREYFGVEEE